MFPLALSEHLNAGVDQRTTFDRYFELINQKITPAELPFRVRLIALNKLRVNSKHFGLEPSKSELEPLLTTVWEFFDEVTSFDLWSGVRNHQPPRYVARRRAERTRTTG